MLTRYSLTVLFAACALTACTDDDSITIAPGASLLVVNDSDFVITDIYLTEVDNPDFGPNLLRGDVLFPDEQLLLGVSCDVYDALVIDEDDVECELSAIDLCGNDATWVIRNDTCDVFRRAAAARL